LNPIRVFVIDDHPICRRGLASMIGQEPGLAWAGESGGGCNFVAEVLAAAPDVVLMDLAMPGTDCVGAMQALQAALPRLRWVLTSGSVDVAAARRGMAAGAGCVLLKSATQQELVDTIAAAARGASLCSAELRQALAARAQAAEPGADLTQRERELLALLARGLGNGDISARLAIAIPTVKFHITNILSKLQAENRTAAVLVALRHNLVHLD
jgi:two-component system, NarL family, response regulator LiaR